MKRVFAIVVIFLFILFVAAQFIFKLDATPLSVNDAETLEATVEVPPDVEQILERSCNDCHTNKTIYPWYAHVQPAGYFLGNHIAEGRKHLNFSTFSTYTQQRKEQKLDQICEEAQSHEMPLPSYLWIHWNAKLSDADIKTLCDWATATQEKVSQK